jgi:hypothetical protein
MAIGRCKPDLAPAQAVEDARQAYAREGERNNPNMAAGTRSANCLNRLRTYSLVLAS